MATIAERTIELELTMTTDVSRVFFSYARADAEFVLKLANDLRSAGIGLWIDQLDISPGERWDSAVESALKASPCLLVVLSPASVASQNVLDEIALALSTDKKVVPVLHTQCDIPFRMQRLQYIDFTLGYDLAFTQVLSVLSGVNAVPPATSAQAPAPAARLDQAWPGTAANRPGMARQWRLYLLLAACLAAVLGVGSWATSATPTTIKSVISKDGGTAGAQRSAQLDYHETLETTGALKMEFEFNRGSCSKARLHIFVDGRLIKQTEFIDGTTGLLDLGPVSSGRHTLTLSPEGMPGGCNSGTLGSWGGTLTLHVVV